MLQQRARHPYKKTGWSGEIFLSCTLREQKFNLLVLRAKMIFRKSQHIQDISANGKRDFGTDREKLKRSRERRHSFLVVGDPGQYDSLWAEESEGIHLGQGTFLFVTEHF